MSNFKQKVKMKNKMKMNILENWKAVGESGGMANDG